MAARPAAASPGSPGALRDVHGIINLDEVSCLFSKMLLRLDQQDRVITDLQHTLTSLVEKNYFQEKVAQIDESLVLIEERLKCLHAATTGRVLEKDFSSGELATSNFYQLQKVSKVLSACISRQEVEQQYRDLMLIDERNKLIQKDLDRLCKVADELNSSHNLLNKRVGALDGMVSTKLDRSELAHLQALAAKVALYDDFRLDTLGALDRLTAHDSATDGRLLDHDGRLGAHSAQLEELTGHINKMATKQDAHHLARQLSSHAEQIAARATQAAHDELQAQLARAQRLLDDSQLRIQHADQRIVSLSTVLQTKASSDEVNARLRTVDFESFCLENAAAMRTKAPLVVTDALQQRAQGIEDTILSESKRTDVAVRFVEWFTTRGEHYEHNLQIIDKHLKDLVVSERAPRVHTYYLPGNRVEMAPYNGSPPPAFPKDS